ncbi:MAG: aspartyl/glutamyl-tRNA amidotransferase subunit A, partial [Phycisphaerales bacterium]|nr:aspartyl/glutamyl-tRNA amidotransferase subunit A [Phycisphaerales bacterium]
TGGSIRQPASFCGVTGIKPTYGRISRWGLVAYASSLDQIGPLGRTVEDVAVLMDVLCGHDPLDSTSAPDAALDASRTLRQPVNGWRVGVPREVRSEHNHPAVVRALDAAVERCRGLGVEVVEVSLPRLDDGIAAYYLVAMAEASSNLARFDGIRYGHRAEMRPGDTLFDLYARSRAEGFGAEVQRRIMLGTHALSSGYYDAYYNTAMKTRRLIREDFDAIFAAGVHAVLMPSTVNPAFRLGEMVDDPLQMYQEDLYTVTINLAGLPALSLPMGVTTREEGDGVELPIGMQFIGPVMGDAAVLQLAWGVQGAGTRE